GSQSRNTNAFFGRPPRARLLLEVCGPAVPLVRHRFGLLLSSLLRIRRRQDDLHAELVATSEERQGATEPVPSDGQQAVDLVERATRGTKPKRRRNVARGRLGDDAVVPAHQIGQEGRVRGRTLDRSKLNAARDGRVLAVLDQFHRELRIEARDRLTWARPRRIDDGVDVPAELFWVRLLS